jgi:hypothetical protein
VRQRQKVQELLPAKNKFASVDRVAGGAVKPIDGSQSNRDALQLVEANRNRPFLREASHMHGRTLLIAFLLSIAPVAVAAAAQKTSPEETILKRANVPVDADGLLTFFRGRTLSDTECKQIGKLIHQLGADNFDDRESASAALQKIGDRATPLLRAAKRGTDVEIAKRAERFLKEVAAPAPLPAVAAARLLARRAPTDAVAVLLAYLPFAADGAVEDEVLTALLALTPDGKADPALTAALTDPLPIQRGAAAYVLGRKGDKANKEAARKLLADSDGGVRWQAANALLAAHDPAAVPALVDLLADGPFDTAWRSEEVLHRLAGDKVTALWLDDSPKQRSKVRDAWAAWWKDKSAMLQMDNPETTDGERHRP